jgi:hypothetical protein
MLPEQQEHGDNINQFDFIPFLSSRLTEIKA